MGAEIGRRHVDERAAELADRRAYGGAEIGRTIVAGAHGGAEYRRRDGEAQKQAARLSPGGSRRAARRQQKMRIGRGFGSVAPSKTRPVPASRDRSRGRRLLSWGWRPFQRSYRRTVARTSVSRSPSAVSRRSGPGHGVFLARRRRVDVEDVRAPPLRGLASPSEYYRAGLPTSSRTRRLPGVPAPSAHADAGAHSPGSCLVPVRVRLQGFSPSCRVTSPASFRPFKAGDAHGVLPFEASPSGRSRGASRRPLPSCRCRHSAYAA